MKSTNARRSAKEPAMEGPAISLVRAQVQEVMEGEEISQSQVATEADLSTAALSQWLGGIYSGSNANVAAKLARWLNARDERLTVQAVVPEPPKYFASASSEDVIKSLRYAQSMELMTMVAGAPGVGKTTSCEEYQRRSPNVWIATLSADTTSLMSVLKEIAAAVGGVKATGAHELAREIGRKIRNRQGLLIVDEAHHATLPALDAIRGIWDRTGIGVALLGAPDLAGKIERMPQLLSRVTIPLYLLGAMKADVDSLLDAWGITETESRRELAVVAKRPGALRAVTQVLRLATSMARGASEPLQHAHVHDSAQFFAARSNQEASHV